MALSLEEPSAVFGQSRASASGSSGDGADPWLMDDAAMRAMGLASESDDTSDMEPTADDKCRHPVAAGRRAFAGAAASAGGGARVSTGVVSGAVDAATYGAAFAAGLLEGSWSAIVDLFQGAADMIEVVAKTAYQLLTANPGAVKDMLMAWVGKLEAVWANRSKIADDFMLKWESDNDWVRGNFQGEVLGWVMMTALLIMATSGAAALTATTGRWAVVLRLLASVDALGDLTGYLGKLGRLPGNAADVLRRRFGAGAESATEGAELMIVREGREIPEVVTKSRDAELDLATEEGKVRHASGGRYGIEQDSPLDLLTDPNPPSEIREMQTRLSAAGEYSRRHDAMVGFRSLVREMLARRGLEVDAVFRQLQRASGTSLERVPRERIGEVFDYLFNSQGIQLDYANYAAWRRLSTGAGTVDDLRFIKHELEELNALREGGLEDPLGRSVKKEDIDSWRDVFLDELFLPAHRKAVDAELVFLRSEILKRTGGRIELSLEEIAMSDPVRAEARLVAMRDGKLLRQNANAQAWDRSREEVHLSRDIAKSLGLLSPTNIADLIRAVKEQAIRGGM